MDPIGKHQAESLLCQWQRGYKDEIWELEAQRLMGPMQNCGSSGSIPIGSQMCTLIGVRVDDDQLMDHGHPGILTTGHNWE
ncbi:hypothetical protein Cadr_000017191 [Camelus dromedarius]|uniref:Uncharacterized protein n=1 Tax=Camelus dromedarius TaxID=9838 RepID=A0A5N4DGJ8_CAMDR|nr:hypothetical protein Cadr_000017191 [Camelus dromedarius]